MKKSLFSVAVLACTCLLVNANSNSNCMPYRSASDFIVYRNPGLQQPPSPEDMAKRQTEWMKEKLALTNDQLTKVDAINLAYAKKIGKMMQEAMDNNDMESGFAKMGELDKQKRAELEKILTADQMVKYDAEMANRRQQGPRP